MTRTQYYTATSVDGFIADERNSLDWLFETDRASDGEDRFGAFFSGVGGMAMGATTYEWILEHERVLDEPAKWHGYYGDTPTWVFSHRELAGIPGVDIRFVSGDVAPVHAAMVAEAAGRNLWLVGGGELVGQFADEALLDDIFLGVAPALLGVGAPLLPRRITGLRLVSVRPVGAFLEIHYTLPGGGGTA